MYDDVVNEEVPEDFLSFLEQADERKGDEGKGDGQVNGADEKALTAQAQRPVKTEP